MQQANTDPQNRRRDALVSACLYSLLLSGTGIGLLCLRSRMEIGGVMGAVLLLSGVLDLGMIIPIWISYHERIKEIEGGEENVAAQY